MAEPDTRQIAGEVFSAKDFFDQCSRASRHPNGKVHFEVMLQDTGLVERSVGHGSLVWVDGVYADSLSQEQFIASLRSGDIPEPLLDRARRSLRSRIVCVTPEHLLSSPQTILSACGLARPLCESALRSRFSTCALCGAQLHRHTSPLQLLDTLARDWRGATISLFAESPEASFAEWATSQGLSLKTNTAGVQSVLLDKVASEPQASTPLGRLLRSAWALPNIRFSCVGTTGNSRVYSPSGWCTACNLESGTTTRANLLSLLTVGVSDAQRGAAESLLSLPGSCTIEQVLTQPVGELTLSADSPLLPSQRLLCSLSLGSLSFGTRTDALGARDLARVAIAASILEAQENAGHLIVDLPRAIFGDSEDKALAPLLGQAAIQRGGSVIGAPFDSTNTILVGAHSLTSTGRRLLSFSLPTRAGNRDYALHTGELMGISQRSHPASGLLLALRTAVSDSAKQEGLSIHMVSIPVFEVPSAGTRVVGETLGLLEPLAQLYAASLDARMHGLQAKDFILFGTRSPRYACTHCHGLGVTLTYRHRLPRPLAAPCTTCGGGRCKAPISSALFRGVSFSTLLNQTIERSAETLAALSKASRVLDLVRTLGLQHMPLGMPLALLSPSERRRLRVIQALTQGKPAKPCVVLFEEPGIGLENSHLEAIVQLRDTALNAGTMAWIDIVK
jgi:hypothetical protein